MKNRQRGFTLVELLVVIAIIGLLSTIGVVSLNSARAKARDAKRLSDVRQISSVMELYFNSNQQYPHAAITVGGLVMNGGCVTEAAVGITAQPCTAGSVVLLPTIPLPPPTPAGGVYGYFGYTGAAPATGAVACDVTTGAGTEVCQSYGIQFTLETSVSGISAGANCFSQNGVTTGACPVAT